MQQRRCGKQGDKKKKVRTLTEFPIFIEFYTHERELRVASDLTSMQSYIYMYAHSTKEALSARKQVPAHTRLSRSHSRSRSRSRSRSLESAPLCRLTSLPT